MNELMRYAQMACDVAIAEGAEYADVVASQGRSIQVEIELGSIKSTDAKQSAGVSVRSYIRGGLGASSTSGSFSEADIRRVARNAVELAQVAEPDPDFVDLPGPSTYHEVSGIYDPRIEALSVSDVMEYVLQNVDAAREVDADAIVSGGSGAGFGSAALVNSLGIQLFEKYSSVGTSIQATVRRGEDVGVDFDDKSARHLDDFSPEGLGTKAAKGALRYLGAEDVETGMLPIILGPMASTMLFHALVQNANAEDIQRRRSYLVGMKGEQVASELVSILDDPLYPHGLSSSQSDGDGYPCRPTVIVDRGVLKTYLHSHYTARKAGEENTGHSTRGGIAPTNLRPALGGQTSEEIIRDTKRGLYIEYGSLSPNSVTGEVSATVDFGFRIENGAIAAPVKNTIIGSNILELLRSIDAISSDYRREPGTVMPTIRIQNVQIAGAR